jgi:uncharacterized oxidoreductase
MKTSNNTVLITGGSAGIGFEIAKLFSENGNHVIITGRNKERLEAAAARLTNVTAIPFDVTSSDDIDQLVARVQQDFPALNVLINNAGAASYYNLSQFEGTTAKAFDEMNTNYLSIVHLNEKLLPLLARQQEAAVVNVSSIVAFVPGHSLPTYSASKAALHAYTQVLRYSLAQDTNVKVFELMPPLVNTGFSKEIGGENGIAPSVVAQDLFDAFEQDKYEVQVGGTKDLFQLYLSSPEKAFEVLNPQRSLA